MIHQESRNMNSTMPSNRRPCNRDNIAATQKKITFEDNINCLHKISRIPTQTRVTLLEVQGNEFSGWR